MSVSAHIATRAPTLVGWVARDLVITLIAAALVVGLHAWHSGAPSWLSVAVVPGAAFIAAYVVCYAYHEWGHLLGAKLAGGHMPLAPYAGALIGYFDLSSHDRRQFLYLSWGGVIGYLTVMACAIGVYLSGAWGLAGAGFAVGAVAFVAQSLAVDLPQIWKVSRGADIVETSANGANAEVILKRTWQTWVPLGLLLAGWHVYSG